MNSLFTVLAQVISTIPTLAFHLELEAVIGVETFHPCCGEAFCRFHANGCYCFFCWADWHCWGGYCRSYGGDGDCVIIIIIVTITIMIIAGMWC